MAKPSIDSFLNHEIANHDWLDPEGKYKENAPQSDHLPYNKRPDLAEAWTMQEVYPEYDVPAPAAIDPNKGKVAVIVNEVKRQMMAGKSLTHIKETVIDKIPAGLKAAAKEEVLKAAKEFPFLGHVYIDTEAFKTATVKGCEQGASLIKHSSKLAVYAKKNASCGTCSLNQGGFCRVYKKALVNEVPYTEKTFKHYQDHLLLANKIDFSTKISSKQDLGNALVGKKSATKEASSVVYHDASKVTKFSERFSESVENKEMRDISRDLSLKLSSGISPELFKKYVTEKYSSVYAKYPEVFKKYANYVGSLGRVFLEAEVFKSVQELQQFINKYPKTKYILASKTSGLTERQIGRKVVSSLTEIPLSVWKNNLSGYDYKLEELKTNPLAVTKKACLNPPKKTVVAEYNSVELAKEVEIEGYNPTHHTLPMRTFEEVRQLLSQGKPIKEILSKTGAHAIKPAVEKFLKTASVIQTSLFETPCDTDFELNKIAKLAPKKACHSCSYNKGMGCSKLDRGFINYTSKSASTQEPTVKQSGSKVAAKIDDEISVELEPTDFDESVKKYL